MGRLLWSILPPSLLPFLSPFLSLLLISCLLSAGKQLRCWASSFLFTKNTTGDLHRLGCFGPWARPQNWGCYSSRALWGSCLEVPQMGKEQGRCSRGERASHGHQTSLLGDDREGRKMGGPENGRATGRGRLAQGLVLRRPSTVGGKV